MQLLLKVTIKIVKINSDLATFKSTFLGPALLLLGISV